MSSISLFFDRIDSKLENKLINRFHSPFEELAKKYVMLQGVFALCGLTIMLIVSWIVGAKMMMEFSLIYILFMWFAYHLFIRTKNMVQVIFYFKIAMIVISSVYVVRMGGLMTCGGLFLLSVQAVTSTVILRDFSRISGVILIFAIAMVMLIVLEPMFPTHDALNPLQNDIFFATNLIMITGYIFFFSFYASNLYSKLEQRETERQKELNDAKTRLYTNITHEFRTPLTVILGMADSAKSNVRENLPLKMDTIIKNGKILLKLVEQLLALSKLESGKLTVTKVHANIIPFLKYIFELQKYYAEEKNISIKFISEDQAYETFFDPEKTAAIVSNLLSNAVKFTPQGGQISLKVSTNKDTLSLEIKDNGIGIPPEKIQKIFDRFYQVDGRDTRKKGGAGIGLALTREFVQLLGGTIGVKSNPGVGTVFTVNLPYASDKGKAAVPFQFKKDVHENPIGRVIESPESAANGHKQLLIVEDNPDVVAYLKVCFQDEFYINVATDGKEGYKMALKEIPDIIISDVMMPEIDGFELCKKLKDDFRSSHIPIILLTAKADIPSRIEGLETGADAYVVKPFNQKELMVRMKKLLELRRTLFEKYSNGDEEEEINHPLVKKEDAFFRKLDDLVEKKLNDENYNIPELCKDMGMSKSQLYRKFKALTNNSAARYIRCARMKKAKQLLQTTSMNITEVSYEVGIKTLSTFSQLFKEEFGVTPSDYNRQIENERIEI